MIGKFWQAELKVALSSSVLERVRTGQGVPQGGYTPLLKRQYFLFPSEGITITDQIDTDLKSGGNRQCYDITILILIYFLEAYQHNLSFICEIFQSFGKAGFRKDVIKASVISICKNRGIIM